MKIRRKKKMAARCVKKAAAPVKAEDIKTEAVKAETVKTEVKAAEVKAEPEKEAAPAAEAAPKKAPARKVAPKKETAAKKAPAKKTTAKKAEVKTEMFLQFAGKEYTEKEIFQKVKDVWTKVLKNKVGDLKDVKIYLKPEDSAAYYVINGDTTGRVEL